MNPSEPTAEKTSLEGLRSRIDARWDPPARLSRDEYLAMDDAEREDYDDQRTKWIGARYWTPNDKTREIMSHVRVALATRDELAVGERGICVYGPSHAGKSTALLHVAKGVERQVARDDPDYRTHGTVPVMWVEGSPEARTRSIGTAITRFMGVPTRSRATAEDLIDHAVQLTIAARTRLVMFDELQMLNLDGRSGEAVVNSLKSFMNKTPALCLFAGIDLPRVMSGPASLQLRRRWDEIEFPAFNPSTAADRAALEQLIAAFSQEAILLDQEATHLMPYATELMHLSGGLIGPLRRIISTATARTILSKKRPGDPECVTIEDIRRAAASLKTAEMARRRVRSA